MLCSGLVASGRSADPYLFMFLSGLLEFPAYGLIWLGSNFLGRRKSMAILMTVCGLCIFLIMLIQLYVPDSK